MQFIVIKCSPTKYSKWVSKLKYSFTWRHLCGCVNIKSFFWCQCDLRTLHHRLVCLVCIHMHDLLHSVGLYMLLANKNRTNAGQYNVPISPMKYWSKFKFRHIFAQIFSHIIPITTKFCTYQDSIAVLVCAKFCCDQASLCWIVMKVIFIKFWKWIGKSLVGLTTRLFVEILKCHDKHFVLALVLLKMSSVTICHAWLGALYQLC